MVWYPGLNGSVSTFYDRFHPNFQGRVQYCLKRFKSWVLFKNVLLRDSVSFSGI